MVPEDSELEILFVITLRDDSLLSEYGKFIRRTWIAQKAKVICSKDYSFWDNNSLQRGAPFIGFVKRQKRFHDIFYTSYFWGNSVELKKNLEAILE